MCLCVTILLHSSHFSHQTLSFPLQLLLTDRLRLAFPPSGLPLPQRLGAAVQFTPPRRGGCAAVAQGTVPVRGDFLFALTGLFVTECDVTVRRPKERRRNINRKSASSSDRFCSAFIAQCVFSLRASLNTLSAHFWAKYLHHLLYGVITFLNLITTKTLAFTSTIYTFDKRLIAHYNVVVSVC